MKGADIIRSGKYYKGEHRNGKKIDTHRRIMEEHLGRKLNRKEVVHHINGDINDNRIENLALMSLSEHSRLHMIGHRNSDECRRKLSEINTGKARPYLWRVTGERVEEAKRRLADGESFRKIAHSLGVSHSTLIDAVKRTGS